MKSKAELTPSEYGEIVWLLKSSWSHEAIARKLGVSEGVVQAIFEEYHGRHED